MKLLFHVLLDSGDRNPYALVVNTANKTLEECYRIEHGSYLSALEAYDYIKQSVQSIDKVYCDPEDQKEGADELVREILQSAQHPKKFFSDITLPQSKVPRII
jgi:hypothetical protein